MHLTLRSHLRGHHVHTALFVGPDAAHLAHAGNLTLWPEEWRAYVTILSLGAAATGAGLSIEHEGEWQASGEAAAWEEVRGEAPDLESAYFDGVGAGLDAACYPESVGWSDALWRIANACGLKGASAEEVADAVEMAMAKDKSYTVVTS